MLTKRLTLLALVLAPGLLGVVAATPAGAQSRPATILRCEADFAGFMIGTGTETIDAGCADLALAYPAGVAAYQARNAECEAIRTRSNPHPPGRMRGPGQVGRRTGLPECRRSDPGRCAGPGAGPMPAAPAPTATRPRRHRPRP